MERRYASHPQEVKQFDTDRLRKEFHIPTLFTPDRLELVLTHEDRLIIGGANPVQQDVKLETDLKELGVSYFLERRELGAINVGGPGSIIVDGTEYELNNKDCLYVGKGSREVIFRSKDASKPAKFYLNSAPAHKEFPTAKTTLAEAESGALGSIENSNERTIHRFIHENGIQSSQLVMGMTQLKTGNMWNTMPAHVHPRRMEAYMYFDLAEDAVVFHLMGEPNETRHLVVRNEQAVISPSWSIHSGVGTSNYTFIWGMAGDNKAYADMDAVPMKDLR
ncbi:MULTISPECIES: 5-dehydro-4-deoxy-D-glucuronate isomerase [Paenibacillus]|jgi:4-deoxy-L-threo-5-hexosulose-uronate ketol-isomerase|uniref:4-deoxy-L-threo-5-hexosulose-uronate ketol-isomerase n=1 Tax=Paenibacillus barengoltzii J12 TaxID=935846 RepID=A0ABY1LSC9_9BACL|nr:MULTISPECIES: 5-dehydro-4-deoxy-D-glucuronate isomerase [Paenibacillus]MDU0332359.1 5-dehydro-4-deoxy-D-glucuronate isomerase [Paenibacillus sp. 3LSP]MEC2343426.1 5-dehydro-4-deoxy-D-glucuronate isomerase [Paenibacillus barengoltzii]SME89512.1 4-deoxy-L-threo-5-hexosulose-uronate ketol-isomerase [Paenibacillus barengoltzii]SME90132.1 4-deoxy-L-threo-5-hexosulose-uronate ketol-isomerase [Paenibacillus barengoltzii J12]